MKHPRTEWDKVQRQTYTDWENKNIMGVQNCGVNSPIILKAVLQETSELPNRDTLQSKAKVNGLLCSALEDTISPDL